MRSDACSNLHYWWGFLLFQSVCLFTTFSELSCLVVTDAYLFSLVWHHLCNTIDFWCVDTLITYFKTSETSSDTLSRNTHQIPRHFQFPWLLNYGKYMPEHGLNVFIITDATFNLLIFVWRGSYIYSTISILFNNTYFVWIYISLCSHFTTGSYFNPWKLRIRSSEDEPTLNIAMFGK